MNRTPVESRTIRSIGFDRDTRSLEVEFRSGSIYTYADVPESLYLDLLHAESKGRFFTDHIRENFSYRRVGDVDLADVASERTEDELLGDDSSPDQAGHGAEEGGEATAPGDRPSRHSWVVDVLEEDSAAIEVDGRSVTPGPRWLLPANAAEGDVLRVSHHRTGTRSSLVIELERGDTRLAMDRSRRQVEGMADGGGTGDVEL